MQLASIDHIKIIELPKHYENNGSLVVMEGSKNVPFPIARVFVVQAPIGATRGRHAHRRCVQFLICSAGCIEVFCEDGAGQVSFTLDRPDIGLLIPAGIWAQQTYKAANSLLTVLCDFPYEAEDYIRDYDHFLDYRKKEQI